MQLWVVDVNCVNQTPAFCSPLSNNKGKLAYFLLRLLQNSAVVRIRREPGNQQKKKKKKKQEKKKTGKSNNTWQESSVPAARADVTRATNPTTSRGVGFRQHRKLPILTSPTFLHIVAAGSKEQKQNKNPQFLMLKKKATWCQFLANKFWQFLIQLSFRKDKKR